MINIQSLFVELMMKNGTDLHLDLGPVTVCGEIDATLFMFFSMRGTTNARVSLWSCECV